MSDAVRAASGVRCPGCHTRMAVEAWAGVQVDRCGECHALWFDAHELDRCLAGAEPSRGHPVTEAELPDRGLGGRSCPRCWPRAMRTVGWTGLVVDRCPHCRGLFVEAGELEWLRRQGAPEESVELMVQRVLIGTGSSLFCALELTKLLIRVLAAILRR